jgi:hypothetical protein
MNTTRLLLAATLAATGFAAHADEADGSQHALQFDGQRTRAEVQAELQQFKRNGVNPWSTQYNQLAGFQSQRTRNQVQADYIASRDRVAAMTGEDSGAAYLAQHGAPSVQRFAGEQGAGQ